LNALSRLGAGVVLASSKTAAEIAPLRDAMGLGGWPAIIENGAGVLQPGETGAGGDTAYRRIRRALADLPPGFQGFGDMAASDVARITGLSPAAARAAKIRQFSEPGLWKGDAATLDDFLAAARAAGLHAQQGGRFLTLSPGGTKADRMGALVNRLSPWVTVALGDAPNDAEMLQAADYGVIVKNAQAPALPPLPEEETGRIIRTVAPGPQGWAEAIFALLDQLGLCRKGGPHG
jgi:mannosyl-3-phosphoglycerate phosphatase